MRILSILLLCSVLGSPVLAAQTPICSAALIPLDKRAEPTVEYEVLFFEQPTLRKMCQHEWAASRDYIWGCAASERGFWGIYVEARLDDANRACVIMHEKAHLPPNSW